MHRDDFAFLEKKDGNKLPVYFDNAATTQSPRLVIDRIKESLETEKFNTGRAMYPWGENATELHELARVRVARFIGAKPQEIVFTSGCTDSMNMLSRMLLINPKLNSGEILIYMESHNSSILPWQFTGFVKKTQIKFFKNIEDLQMKISPRTKLVIVPHVTNVTGEIVNVKDIAFIAHRYHALVVVDTAQSVGKLDVKVDELGADFLAFSAHKMYGPAGVGVLYMRSGLGFDLLPMRYGGGAVAAELGAYNVQDMFLPGPAKYEPGTRDLAGEMGLVAAIDYIESIGYKKIKQHTEKLTDLFVQELKNSEKVYSIYEPHSVDSKFLSKPYGVISFLPMMISTHPHDLAALLGENGYCVRAGMMCAGRYFGYLNKEDVDVSDGCLRVSFGIYNTVSEVRRFVKFLNKIYDELYEIEEENKNENRK